MPRSFPSPTKADLNGPPNLAAQYTTQGKLQINVTKGLTVPEVFKEHYRITQPLIHFNAAINADLSKKGVHCHAAFKSDLTRMEIDNTTTHDLMLHDLLQTLPNGSVHR